MLTYSDNDIIKIAEKFKTPFYLYNAEEVKRKYKLLSMAFGSRVDVYYSIKANPNLSLCNLLKKLNAGAEVCSEYELLAAIKVGFDPKNIIYVGPAKSEKSIKMALSHNINFIVCESLSEYERIERLAKELNILARVVIRINPNFVAKNALLKMGGKPSQFGMDENIIFENLNFFKNKKNIEILGIHVYNGTRILDAESIVENTKSIFLLAKKFSHIFKINLKVVDIGGGIGVPYYENEEKFDLNKLNTLILPELNKFHLDFPGTKIILESGRFLVAEAGIFVSRIIDVKSSKGENFIITDGGTNCHMAANVTDIFKRNFPIKLISHQKNFISKPMKNYHITGPLCTPGDLIGKNILLNTACENDFIVIEKSGAYGATFSPVLFLSHGYPCELLMDKENVFLIRSRDSENDFFKNQNIFN